uniref:Uncharacterized protein n=1 Tax=Glossina palpalis gambiensis TaxID=67801 RepID=A0A1B0B003_9MUSC
MSVKNPLTFTSALSIKLQYLGEYQNFTDRVICNKDGEDKIIFRENGQFIRLKKKLLFEYTVAPILISMLNALGKHLIRHMMYDMESRGNPPIMVRKQVVWTDATK